MVKVSCCQVMGLLMESAKGCDSAPRKRYVLFDVGKGPKGTAGDISPGTKGGESLP